MVRPDQAGKPDHHTAGMSEIRSKRFGGVAFRHSDDSTAQSEVHGAFYANILAPRYFGQTGEAANTEL